MRFLSCYVGECTYSLVHVSEVDSPIIILIPMKIYHFMKLLGQVRDPMESAMNQLKGLKLSWRGIREQKNEQYSSFSFLFLFYF